MSEYDQVSPFVISHIFWHVSHLPFIAAIHNEANSWVSIGQVTVAVVDIWIVGTDWSQKYVDFGVVRGWVYFREGQNCALNWPIAL